MGGYWARFEIGGECTVDVAKQLAKLIDDLGPNYIEFDLNSIDTPCEYTEPLSFEINETKTDHHEELWKFCKDNNLSFLIEDDEDEVCGFCVYWYPGIHDFCTSKMRFTRDDIERYQGMSVDEMLKKVSLPQIPVFKVVSNKRTISTGEPSTLKTYRKIAVALFGKDSPATAMLDKKISESSEDEEVVADESQMMYLICNLGLSGK